MDSLLEKLNAAQREAVTYVDGPLLILAGAGSGKTRALTHKVAWLVEQGVHPLRILAVTFTNKAAREMKERVSGLLPPSSALPQVSTFHSFGLRFLQRHGEALRALGYPGVCSVIDGSDQLKIVKDLHKAQGESLLERELRGRLQGVLKLKGILDETGLSVDANLESLIRIFGSRETVFRIFDLYTRYEAVKKAQGYFDFDDLILLPVRLLSQNEELRRREQDRLNWVLVDEYQDVSAAQTRLIDLLLGPHTKLAVVGDPDQLIYSWRGAEMDSIMTFRGRYKGAKVVMLTQNYRCDGAILAASNALIAKNKIRPEKELWTERQAGMKPRVVGLRSGKEEALYVANRIIDLHEQGFNLKDMVVLYRTNAQSRALEDALRRARIQYRVVRGQNYFDRREVKDVISYLRLAVNPADRVSLDRVGNLPARGLGPKTMEGLGNRLVEMASAMPAQLVWDELLNQAGSFPARVAAGVRQLAGGMKKILQDSGSLPTVLRIVLAPEGLDYERAMQDYDDAGFGERYDNVMELLGALDAARSEEGGDELMQLLNHAALFTDLDGEDGEENRVSLSTLHAVKGLEFPVVFMVGMEDRLFPSPLALVTLEGLEEERRLCYVGMTRAEEQLYLTYARERMRYGQVESCSPSQFLHELPKEGIQIENRTGRSVYGAYGDLP